MSDNSSVENQIPAPEETPVNTKDIQNTITNNLQNAITQLALPDRAAMHLQQRFLNVQQVLNSCITAVTAAETAMSRLNIMRTIISSNGPDTTTPSAAKVAGAISELEANASSYPFEEYAAATAKFRAEFLGSFPDIIEKLHADARDLSITGTLFERRCALAIWRDADKMLRTVRREVGGDDGGSDTLAGRKGEGSVAAPAAGGAINSLIQSLSEELGAIAEVRER
ncbi:hypothetical protein GGS21DRAFT_519812 [Xylaria nigripes]|nr:hypothetical protein GGS21DRAFT_519812 [Xylaria nigripes]